LYWFSNNIWTFAQQHYVFGKIEKEDEAKRQEAIERRAANAPPPGAKPTRPRKTASGSPNGASAGTPNDADDGDEAAAKDIGESGPKPTKPNPGARPDGAGSRAPRPGARPKKRKR
jgi:YidC/Oxa1 family membrane protein insertase